LEEVKIKEKEGEKLKRKSMTLARSTFPTLMYVIWE
jgi:hypothetical protein